MKRSHTFKVGDLVRVRLRKYSNTARIVQCYPDIEGGVLLDKELHGFRSWNIADLAHVTLRPARKSR